MSPAAEHRPIQGSYAPHVDGIDFRGYAGDGDGEVIAAIINASNAANGLRTKVSAASVHNNYTHLTNCDLANDFVLAECEGDGVAYGRCDWSHQDNGEFSYFHLVHVVPEWRRHGIGSAILRYLQARLRQYADRNPREAVHNFTTWIEGDNPGAIALLTEDGYAPTRYGYGMVRSLAKPLPDAPLPPGIEVRPVQPEHYRLIWEADTEAFRDHEGYIAPTEVDYDRWLTDPVTFKPALWQIAWDVERNEVAGQVRSFIDVDENKECNRKRGYTEFISTRRPWRRQGLARALLVRSMEVLKQHQMDEAGLGVDAQNPNGALQLYQDVGFEVELQTTRYQRPLYRQPAY